jgi:ribosomal protein L11 methyltransferase
LLAAAALLDSLFEHPAVSTTKAEIVLGLFSNWIELTMTQEWIDVQVQSSLDAGELAGLLNDPWMVGSWQEDGLIHLYWPQERWTSETREALTALVQRLGADAASITIHSLPDADWNAAWARSVKPLRVGQRILIRPSWEPVMVSTDDVEIILDPKQAFGTGHHATTQLLLEWLEARIRGGERVLDVGTGSGILAMVALKLGAVSAWGIDHDPVAIDCAQGYAVENAFGTELTLDTSALKTMPAHQFDVVLANLDRRSLLEIRDVLPLALHRDGQLVLSGILTGDRADLVNAFSQSGGVLAWEQDRDGWLAIAFTFHREAPR